jgi:hypothetical protein
MADYDATQVAQDIQEVCQPEPDNQPGAKKSELRRLAEVLKTMESKQERQVVTALLDSLLFDHEEQKEKEREAEFLKSKEYELAQAVFGREALTPGSPSIANYIAMIDGIKNITFPELRETAPAGATFAEATGLDPEYIQSRRVLVFEEALWNALYPPTTTEPAEADELTELQSEGTPKYYISPNTAINNALQNLDGAGQAIGEGPFDLPVLNVGKDNEITTYVNAAIVDGPPIKGEVYEEYNRAIEAAIWSLYLDRTKKNMPPIATADMIYRIMTHKTEQERVSARQRARVNKGIKQMFRIWLEVDATAEMQKRNIKINGKPIERFRLKGFQIPGRIIEVKAGGEVVEAFLFYEPLLLKYAMHTKQLFTIDGDLLAIKKIDKAGNITPAIIPNTEIRIAAKNYVLRRIEAMRADESKAIEAYTKYKERAKKESALPQKELASFRKMQRVILFKSIYEAAGITAKNSQTNIKEFVLDVLRYWKAKRFIMDFETRQKGRQGSADAVTIKL